MLKHVSSISEKAERIDVILTLTINFIAVCGNK